MQIPVGTESPMLPAHVFWTLSADPPVADREATGLAVRVLLARLVERAPGRSVEVRVPPYAAVQAVEVAKGKDRRSPPRRPGIVGKVDYLHLSPTSIVTTWPS